MCVTVHAQFPRELTHSNWLQSRFKKKKKRKKIREGRRENRGGGERERERERERNLRFKQSGGYFTPLEVHVDAKRGGWRGRRDGGEEEATFPQGYDCIVDAYAGIIK